MTRRGFLGAAVCLPAMAQAGAKRIAVIATEYAALSDTQHMVDAFLVGYPEDGAWRKPEAKVASLYVEKMAGGLGEARAKEFGFATYPNVAEALRCGGKKLAVDAAMVFGDHLEACVKVFEEDGRAVPLYGDSASYQGWTKVAAAAKRMRFPVLAGSAVPLTWRLPDVEVPMGATVEAAVMVAGGGRPEMEFRALEAMQSLLERRKGGETGVRRVSRVEGDAVWKADWPRDLMGAALSRSDTPQGLTLKDGRTQDLLGSGQMEKLATKPAMYLVEYRDGLKATMFALNGAIADFNFAARVSGHGVISTQFLLTPAPNGSYSAKLASKMERMFAGGFAPYPMERTMLASGILESCDSARDGAVETPHLNVKYQARRS